MSPQVFSTVGAESSKGVEMMNPQEGASSRTSGVTAKTAAVLALVIGAFAGLGVVGLAAGGLSGGGGKQAMWHDWLAWLLLGVAAVFLLAGGVLLLMRRLAGRLLIVIGCGVYIAGMIVGWSFGPHEGGAGRVITAVVGALLMIVTAALALAPSTPRWCQSVQPGTQTSAP
jgi:hypothetical protein